jgi:hypothetical protein
MTAVATRVAQLLRLSISTDRDGEAAAALAALRRTLDGAGLDHHALAAAVEAGLQAPAPEPEPKRRYAVDSWRDQMWFAHHHRDQLPPHEQRFIAVLLTYQNRPSEKQLRWLADINARLGGRS